MTSFWIEIGLLNMILVIVHCMQGALCLSSCVRTVPNINKLKLFGPVLSLVVESLSRVFTSNLRTKIPYSACMYSWACAIFTTHEGYLTLISFTKQPKKMSAWSILFPYGVSYSQNVLMAHTSFEVYIVFEIFHPINRI